MWVNAKSGTAAAALLGIAVLTAAGCGSSNSHASQPTVPATTAPSSTAAAPPSTSGPTTSTSTTAAPATRGGPAVSAAAGSGGAAELAAKAGCTGLNEGAITNIKNETGATSAGECTLDGVQIGLFTFTNPSDVQNGIMGLAALGGSSTKVYVAVGPNWIGAGAKAPTQKEAAAITAKLGGTVQLARVP